MKNKKRKDPVRGKKVHSPPLSSSASPHDTNDCTSKGKKKLQSCSETPKHKMLLGRHLLLPEILPCSDDALGSLLKRHGYSAMEKATMLKNVVNKEQ